MLEELIHIVFDIPFSYVLGAAELLKLTDYVVAEWVKNKIRQLHNSYSKARKMASSGSARKQVTKRTAWLQERLQFLAPFVGGRDTVCNLNDDV